MKHHNPVEHGYGTKRHHDGSTDHGASIAGTRESHDKLRQNVAGGEHDQGMHSRLRSQDNPHSDAKQAKGRATGEHGYESGPPVGKTVDSSHEHHIAGGEHAHHEMGEGRAEHHPPTHGEPHRFPRPATSGAHGFGHGVERRQGPLRLSGHSGAHQIGRRK